MREKGLRWYYMRRFATTTFKTTQGCNIVLNACNIVPTTPCLTKNHRCKSSRVTSPSESWNWTKKKRKERKKERKKKGYLVPRKKSPSKKPIQTAKFNQETKMNWFENSMRILSTGAHWVFCKSTASEALQLWPSAESTEEEKNGTLQNGWKENQVVWRI